MGLVRHTLISRGKIFDFPHAPEHELEGADEIPSNDILLRFQKHGEVSIPQGV